MGARKYQQATWHKDRIKAKKFKTQSTNRSASIFEPYLEKSRKYKKKELGKHKAGLFIKDVALG